jgi:hypothetical protein
MACPRLYVESEIIGNRQPANEYAVRGQEVHRIIASYIRHLVRKGKAADWEYFDQLLPGISAEAQEILLRFREGFTIDPSRVIGAEVYIALDAEFFPVAWGERNSTEADREVTVFSDNRPSYEMTLDYAQLEDVDAAVIDDWKSYWQVINPDTFQARLYSLGLMCVNPKIQRVRFRLHFVRWGVTREVLYERGDLKAIAREVRAERDRQIGLHAGGAVTDFPTYPGRHCAWCPLLASNECPLGKRNPYAVMEPEERLQHTVYLQQALKDSLATLKGMVTERGSVEAFDGNGTKYVASFELQVRTSYPLEPTQVVLDQWEVQSGERLGDQLSVSGLNSLLKVKKRAPLADLLRPYAQTKVRTQLFIGAVDGEDEDEEYGDA